MAHRARFDLSRCQGTSLTDPPESSNSHRPSSPLAHHGLRRTRRATRMCACNTRGALCAFSIEEERRFPERAGHINTRPGTQKDPELEPGMRAAAEAPRERSDA